MEQYYIKRGKRYIPVGYSLPDIPDGLYFSQKDKFGRRGVSINYWMGCQPQPIDLQQVVNIMSADENLCDYISKLEDTTSEEYKKAKEEGLLVGPVSLSNISRQSLSILVLRFIYEELQRNRTAN